MCLTAVQMPREQKGITPNLSFLAAVTVKGWFYRAALGGATNWISVHGGSETEYMCSQMSLDTHWQ